MFEKMGQSLAATGHFQVHIIGISSARVPQHPDITFHAARPFRRLSGARMWRPWVILRQVWALKPAVWIINTHELLPMGAWLRLLTGARLVYDVRENYYRNIRYLPSFPRLLRWPLATYVRLKERLLTPFVNLFVLSDAGYQAELPFPATRCLVVENKISEALQAATPRPPKTDSPLQLLFSGTLAPSTGVFAAIALATQLHAREPRIHLTIIGYCAQISTLYKIKQHLENKPFITLIGGDQLVPHADIVAAAKRADFGIVAYPPNPASINTTPTKLYEYLAARLPILLATHPRWQALCNRYAAAIAFNPVQPDLPEIQHRMRTQVFYTTPPGTEILWEHEFSPVLEWIERQ